MAYDRYNKGLQDYWKTLIADEKWTEQQKFKERYEGELDEWEDYQKHLRKKARTKKTLGTIKDIAMFAAGGGFTDDDDDDNFGGGKGVRVGQMEPVPVTVPAGA